MSAKKCPVCGGAGKIWHNPNWRYPSVTAPNTGWYNTCHGCGGSGVVYGKCCKCCCKKCNGPCSDSDLIINFSIYGQLY